MSSTSIPPSGLIPLNISPVPPETFVHPSVPDPVQGDKFIYSGFDGKSYTFPYTSMENVEPGIVKKCCFDRRYYVCIKVSTLFTADALRYPLWMGTCVAPGCSNFFHVDCAVNFLGNVFKILFMD